MEDIQELYRMYSKDLYKFILSMSLDQEIAKDIMQNTFLNAIKSLHTFKGKSSIKTWLIAIAKNEYYKYIKKNPLNKSIDEISLREIHYNDKHNDEIKERYKAILEIISKLEEPQRQVMILRLINEFSFKEIGETIGKSENYCRVIFFREKKKLIEKT